MGLLELPPELILRISSHLTTPEYGALRRTCKHIEATLFDSFAKEFFTKRQFMIEQVSLQALVDIANHPTLSGRLTEVIIGLDTLDTDSDYSIETSEARYRAGHVSRSVLLETGQARDMLVEAFSKLPQLRTVGLRDYAGAGRLRDGPNARWNSYGWSLGDAVNANGDGTAAAPVNLDDVRFRPMGMRGMASPVPLFPLILYALGLAHSKPQNIDVFLRRRLKLTPSSFQVTDGFMATAVAPVLAALKRLMMTIAPPERFLGVKSSATPLKRFLHHTPNLQTLRVNFDPDQSFAEDLLEWLSEPAMSTSLATISVNDTITPVALTNLTDLDLGMMSVPGPILSKVISKFGLKSLSLWKVSLRSKDKAEHDEDPGRWAHFFLNLSTTLLSSTTLKSVLVGYATQCYDQAGDLAVRVPVHFTSGGGQSDERRTRLPNVVAYRAAYGSSVKDWLHELSARTSVLRPGMDSESSEDEEDDGEDADGGEDGEDDADEDEDDGEDD